MTNEMKFLHAKEHAWIMFGVYCDDYRMSLVWYIYTVWLETLSTSSPYLDKWLIRILLGGVVFIIYNIWVPSYEYDLVCIKGIFYLSKSSIEALSPQLYLWPYIIN